MIPNPHDAIVKAVFGQPEHARGMLRAIAPAVLGEALDWSTLTEHILEPNQVRIDRGPKAGGHVGREVSTQQAADLLNVSRQYLVRLLGEGRIAFRKTGKHRRLRIEDVLAFKEKRDKDRRAGLRELSQMTQELGGYDSELK